MIEWIPNKIFGSNTGSFDRSADQTASGYVNTPINNNHIITTLGFSQIFIKWKIMIGGKILESRELRIENWERPGGAEDGDANGDGNTDGGEGVGGHLNEGVGPRARICSCTWHDPIWSAARKCDFLISESLSLSLSLSFFPVVSYLLFVGQRSSGHSSIGLNVLRAAHP